MNRIWRGYVATVEALCFVGISGVLVVGALQVFFRYVVGSSLFWSEELMRYMMLWLIAAGSGLAFTRGQFLGMRLLVEMLPRPIRRGCDVLAAILMLIFLGVLIWYGFQFSWGTRQQSATALGISMFWVHVSVVVAAVLLALHVLLNEILGIARDAGAKEHPMGAEDAL